MTRKEEIKEARHEWYLRTQDADFCAGFQKGAEWADRTMIEKACEWLTRELCYIARGNNFFNNKTATDEFVESFRKAMGGDEQ